MLILFQATVLNVAFNSHNKSLLVIMMSNNVSISVLLFGQDCCLTLICPHHFQYVCVCVWGGGGGGAYSITLSVRLSHPSIQSIHPVPNTNGFHAISFEKNDVLD